jgi:hypothetical protein
MAPAPNRLAMIRDLLEQDPVCLALVQYFTRNIEAADTARGIADWWIKRDAASTQHALLRLLEYGIVRSYPVQDNAFVYAYTRSPVLRHTLAQYVNELSAPSPVPGT